MEARLFSPREKVSVLPGSLGKFPLQNSSPLRTSFSWDPVSIRVLCRLGGGLRAGGRGSRDELSNRSAGDMRQPIFRRAFPVSSPRIKCGEAVAEISCAEATCRQASPSRKPLVAAIHDGLVWPDERPKSGAFSSPGGLCYERIQAIFLPIITGSTRAGPCFHWLP
ncbi:hypothetical protein H696_05110 [Fonticula alba]|uniref:Uncharacterized protein n=1 Tax=Fonticula alba TaxID=691883 RepID=A0A058Z216_FONAL|nr:hypothetical protein H696_05110 [Fonticula alba]KCV68181.1 hypothetical protein H696_05110 [Fonticula alba]|eukprot:XP_009497235.1 hypothetical protein H696_05110 [Fonticula alba]